MTAKRPITAYTLTFNEARQLRAVLESVAWADEIIVVDSFSTDGTVEIAREFNARVISEKFCGFGKLRNFALDAAKNDWMFSIDSDERCTPEFHKELDATLESPQFAAYYVSCLHCFPFYLPDCKTVSPICSLLLAGEGLRPSKSGLLKIS